MLKTKSGFTIVELLIVIVIIGILAAITVVAYQEITTQARNASMKFGVGQYINAIKTYSATHDKFPQPATSAEFSGACLGEGYTTGYCWHSEDINGNVTGNWTTQTWFISALREQSSTLPPLPVDIYLTEPDGDKMNVGAIYAFTGNMSPFWNTNFYDSFGVPHGDAFIQFVLRGLQGTFGQRGGCGPSEAYCFPQPKELTNWGLDVTTGIMVFEDGNPTTPSGWPYPL